MACVCASDQGTLGKGRGVLVPLQQTQGLSCGQCPPLLRPWQVPLPQSPDVSFDSGSALTNYVMLRQHPDPSEPQYPQLEIVMPPHWGLIVRTEGGSVLTHKHHHME